MWMVSTHLLLAAPLMYHTCPVTVLATAQNLRSPCLLQDPELSALRQPGIDVQLHDEPHTLLTHFFYVSGYIPRVTPYETGNPNHASQWVSVSCVLIALSSCLCFLTVQLMAQSKVNPSHAT